VKKKNLNKLLFNVNQVFIDIDLPNFYKRALDERKSKQAMEKARLIEERTNQTPGSLRATRIFFPRSPHPKSPFEDTPIAITNNEKMKNLGRTVFEGRNRTTNPTIEHLSPSFNLYTNSIYD